jgi:YegS/Rv2252/BmrU family lipid kinase
LEVEHELVLSERPWDAAVLAQAAAVEGFEVVVAVGGDGTANEVLNGLMLAKTEGVAKVPAMGVIGVGRGNDFAFGVNIPGGIAEGCATLAQGNRRSIDVGEVEGGMHPGGRFFGNGVGIGFDAQVGFEALKMKRLSGFPSYIAATLKTVFLYYRAPLLRIELDDEVLEQRSLLVSVMNGRRMGGGFLMAPQGEPDDGLFDLCIARQVSRPTVFALIPKFMAGSQQGHGAIRTGRARHVRVTALSGVMPAHADGETLSVEGKQLTMMLHADQLEVVCQGAEPAR